MEAIAADTYDSGGADISVTSLWKPPQLVNLVRAHKDDIRVDASDLIPSALGSAFHALMERNDRHGIKEKRLFAHIEGKLISGQFDRLLLTEDEAILQDYKVTTVGRFNRARDGEWDKQLNTYAHLLRLNGIKVSALQVIVLLRDWLKPQSLRSLEYPSLMVQVVDIPMWDPQEAEQIIAAQVRVHETVRPCTPEEMWHKPARHAVMKEGRKSALKLMDNEEAATYFISQQKGSGYYIEKRPEAYTRCSEYCEAAPFCPQWKALNGENNG